MAQQRSAAPCGGMRCGAAPCPAVRCCVVLRDNLYFKHTAIPGMKRSTRYQVPGNGMYGLCTRILVFASVETSRSPCFPPPTNYTRTADQNVTPQQAHSTAQHSTGQLALHQRLLALSTRCSHQMMGLFFLHPLHVLVASFLARA